MFRKQIKLSTNYYNQIGGPQNVFLKGANFDLKWSAQHRVKFQEHLCAYFRFIYISRSMFWLLKQAQPCCCMWSSLMKLMLGMDEGFGSLMFGFRVRCMVWEASGIFNLTIEICLFLISFLFIQKKITLNKQNIFWEKNKC